MSVMDTLSDFIRDAQMTRSQFAERVGISAPYLSQIMSGSRRPSIDVAFRIAEATRNSVPVDAWAKKPAAPSGGVEIATSEGMRQENEVSDG